MCSIIKKSIIALLILIISILAAVHFKDPEVNLRAKIQSYIIEYTFIPYLESLHRDEVADFVSSITTSVPSTNGVYQDGVMSYDMNITADDGYDIPVRIFRPENIEKPPLLIWVHGGGFVVGAHDDSPTDEMCQVYAKSGIAVVSVGYRLAPKYRYTIGQEDVYNVWEWTEQLSGDDLFFDKERISLGGESAGAIISLTTSLISNNQRGSVPLDRLVLIYAGFAPYINIEEDNYLLSQRFLKFFHKMHLKADGTEYEDEFRHVLTEKYDFSSFPETILISASLDPLRETSFVLEEQLKSHGVKTHHHSYENAIHGFYSFSFLPESQDAQQKVVNHILHK